MGNRSRREEKKASDSQGDKVVTTVDMQIQGWIAVENIKEFFDVKTGSFKAAEVKELLSRRGGTWLGVIRIRCPDLFSFLPSMGTRWPTILVFFYHLACTGKIGIGVFSLPIRIN